MRVLYTYSSSIDKGHKIVGAQTTDAICVVVMQRLDEISQSMAATLMLTVSEINDRQIVKRVAVEPQICFLLPVQ